MTKTTTDHVQIREWIEERGGVPARVKTNTPNDNGGILRVNYPGFSEADLEEISWEEFFTEFENSNLAFLYQDETADGEESRFSKFVSRDETD